MQFRNKIRLLFIIAFSLLGYQGISQNLTNDNSDYVKCYWGDVGLGGSSLGSISAALGFHFEINRHVLITANIMGEANSFIDFSSKPKIDVNTFNLLVGKISKQKSSIITYSAGLGLINYYKKTYPGGFLSPLPAVTTKKYSIGIPLLISGYLIGFRTVGFGLSVYANLNTINTTAGLTLNFGIGRM